MRNLGIVMPIYLTDEKDTPGSVCLRRSERSVLMPTINQLIRTGRKASKAKSKSPALNRG